MTTRKERPNVPPNAPRPPRSLEPPPPPPPRRSKTRLDIEIIEIAVKAATVRPGDTLLLIAKNHLTDDEYSELSNLLDGAMPGVRTVVVDTVEQALVYRPGTDDEALPDG